MHASNVRAPNPAPLPARPTATEKRLPLTPAQHALWLVNQMSSEASLACTESATLQLAGPLDLEALRRSLQALVARHEMLRTTFSPVGDTQIVADKSAVMLSFHDCSRWVAPRADHSDMVRDFATQWGAVVIRASVRPFDLVAGPLFRPVLVRGDAQHHILALIVHAIVCDESSLAILVREWGQLYAADVAHRPAVLAPEPAFSCAVGRRPDADAADAKRYWEECFKDGASNLTLPADRVRPTRRNYAGDFASRTLTPELSRAVRQFCAQGGRTASTTMLAAFIALLHRLSGENESVIGVPMAAQESAGQPGLVGPFSHLLPIRSLITEDELFATHLAAVQRSVAAAGEHRGYSFPWSLGQVNAARDAGGLPLLSVLFTPDPFTGALEFGGLVPTWIRSARRCGNCDLNASVTFAGDLLTLECDYSAELFDRATVERWLAHFETLLKSLIAQPECPLSRLPLLTPEEYDQIVIRWNETRKPFEREKPVAALFEDQVERTPNAVALVAGDEHITYRDLVGRVSRLAQRLRACDVGPDTLVGVFAERTAELVVAILAVLKAGGAYVPLDPAYPAERLEYIVRDTAMRCLVTGESLMKRLPAGDFDLIVGDREARDRIRRPRAPAAAVWRAPMPDDLAYVIYTSGSTGQPKGVAIMQHCVAALVAWARDWYRPEELDGLLFSTSASFDISVFELFCPLCLGGKIVLADSLLHLPTLKARNEVRHLSGVPSALAEIVRANAVPPTVMTVTLAGEPLPGSLVDALYRLPHVRRVFELYGPTETTVYSAGALRQPDSPPTLGRPLPNEQIYVLDPHLQPVPIGVRGEIYIGGEKLARGYLHRPDLTAERFIPSPFGRGGRLYRTGDLGRWRADGLVESLGRTDDQVKVWGFRIELGEVEAVLARHPFLAEVAVIARPARTGSNRLIAYVMVRGGGATDARTLRSWLQRQLPDHMLPSSIVLVDRLPRTANGKVDRRRLAQIASDACTAASPSAESATERVIGDLCGQVLGREHVGLHDNFFTLGGNLVRANELMTRVKAATGANLSWPQFFAQPTVAALSGLVDAAQHPLARGPVLGDGTVVSLPPTPARIGFSS